MKKNVLVLISLLWTVGLSTSAQSWEWVRTGLSENTEHSDNICVDPSGNVFVMGQSETEISFGSVTLSSAKERFSYLAKYNPNGDVLWAKKIVDSDNGLYELVSLASDPSGNVVVVGYYYNTQTIIDEEFTPVQSGWRDAFILKLNAGGEKQWIKTGTGNLDVNAYDVVSDSEGSFYMAADYIGEATFGSFTVSADNLNLNNQILVVKYLADGTVVWLTQAGGLSFDNPTGIACDGTKIYLTGYFSSVDAAFGSYSVDCDEVTSIFLAQLEPSDGSFDWVKVIESGLSVTGISKEENGHIAVNDHAIYLSGYYRDHAVFDTDNSLDNQGEHGFLASFTKSGAVNWVHEVISEAPGMPYSLSVSEDHIYIVGNYITSVSIHETELTGTPPAGMFIYLSNAYIYSFSEGGEVTWAKSIDAYYASSYDAGSAIINGVAAFGNYIYTSGEFTKTIEFSPFELSSNNSVDVFLGKINTLANSTESIKSELQVNVYPNPGTDFIHVAFASDTHSNQKISLVDLSGRELLVSQHEGNGIEQMDVRSLRSGVYILTISSEKEKRAFKIIKK